MKEGRLGVYRRLLGYLQPHWRNVLLAYVAMIVATVMNLAVPQIIKQAIDRGLTQGTASTLFWAGGVILALAIGRGLVAFVRIYYGEWLTHRVAFDLRNHFYASLQSLPFAFHD